MKPAIKAEAVCQDFGRRRVLVSIDLELSTGERLAVLGDNGAGKTTLLRLLATLNRPSSGKLALFGMDSVRRRDSVRARIGYMGHQPGLYPALSALENLVFFALLHGLDRSAAESALDSAGLAATGSRPAGELSRGMQQRVAIARALLHDPELVILDEPDAGLDASARAGLDRQLRGRTVVLATHDLGFARATCGRSLRLREGRPLGDEFSLAVLS